jgi:hypothetical protein
MALPDDMKRKIEEEEFRRHVRGELKKRVPPSEMRLDHKVDLSVDDVGREIYRDAKRLVKRQLTVRERVWKFLELCFLAFLIVALFYWIVD